MKRKQLIKALRVLVVSILEIEGVRVLACIVALMICLALYINYDTRQMELFSRATVVKLTDQVVLGKVAVEAKDPDVRRIAVEKLTDQALLAKIAVEGQYSSLRCTAAKKLTDQALLAKIAVESKDSEVRRVAVMKLDDQTVLAKIAVEDQYSNLRRAAIEKLTDQAVLAKIAVESKDSEERRLAVMKLDDQTVLAKIAVEDQYYYLRCAAAKKLTDQALLAKIAVESKDSEVSRAAAKKLTDQALLAKMGMWINPELTRQVTDQALLAKIAVDESKESEVRRVAVMKLDDQTVLAKIAVKDEDGTVRHAAVMKLTGQTLLAKIAMKEKLLEVRVAAIGKVIDQVLLRQWAEKDAQSAIRLAAVTQIADDMFLAQRLPTEPSAAVRAAIIETLHEKDSLRGVARTAYHQEDRKQALRRLQKAFNDPAIEIVAIHKAIGRRIMSLSGEKDNGKLLALALEGEFDILRTAAVRQMNDPLTLEEAGSRATDRDVLKILLAKLQDKAILKRIAGSAEYLPMRLAVERKSGTKLWGQIFEEATAKGSTVQMLGDALAAVSLFTGVQEEAVSGVQNACVNLIRRGDESRIPEMVDLLEVYGDKVLAEDYLNCGQPDLDTTSRKWANLRGYSVGTGAGSHRATWGSGK